MTTLSSAVLAIQSIGGCRLAAPTGRGPLFHKATTVRLYGLLRNAPPASPDHPWPLGFVVQGGIQCKRLIAEPFAEGSEDVAGGWGTELLRRATCR